MIITIARECGSGGHAVGKQLSKELGIPLMDQKSLVEEAKKAGIYLELEAFLEEKPVNSLLYSIAMNEGAGMPMPKILDHMRDLLDQRDCIYMGRCGNVLFRDREDCVSIFLHGEKDAKLEKIQKTKDLDLKKAEIFREKTDKSRADFHQYYTGEIWGYAGNYQMTLDSTRLGTKKTCQMILDYIEKDDCIKK